MFFDPTLLVPLLGFLFAGASFMESSDDDAAQDTADTGTVADGDTEASVIDMLDGALSGDTGGDDGTDALVSGGGAEGGDDGTDALVSGGGAEGGDAEPVIPGEEFYLTDEDDVQDGTEGDDIMYGAGGDDILTGGAGSDLIRGDSGNDELWGGAGDDRMSGNTGDDYINGEDGNDSLLGRGGNDILLGGAGTDTLSAGTGDDILSTDLLDATADFTRGDVEIVDGGDGDDTIYFSRGDQVSGGNDTDSFNLIAARDDTDSQIALITDFDSGTEDLTIYHDFTGADGAGPVLSTQFDVEGQTTSVFLDDTEVLQIDGAAQVEADEIALIAGLLPEALSA